jgi:5S rRNA maturation endonuclease (ribonuclease M5)
VKVKKQVDLKDLIFEKVSQEQIFRFYYPYDFKLNHLCLSAFVKERNPSMIIGTKSQDGDIIFKCFNSHHRGDCIVFVKELFNLDYREALEKIAKDFGILEIDNVRYESIIKQLPVSKITKKKTAPDIVVATRSFNNEELSYWNDYYQDEEDLKREHIFAPKKIWINKVPLVLKSTELTFCYYYPEIDKWKLYKPFAPKDRKWFTNIFFDYIENIDNIQDCQRVFIAKSKKDKMVLSKAIGTSCMITTQAEDLGCFNERSIECLKNKEVFTLYDNDTKGKSASWVLTNNFGFKHCNVPDKYLKENITDFADLAKNYSIDYVYNHFKKKNLI